MLRRQGPRIDALVGMTLATFAQLCRAHIDTVTLDLHDHPRANDRWLELLGEFGLRPQVVILSGTRVTDKGLAMLAQTNPHLESIYVASTAVTSAGLRHLLGCPRLLEVIAPNNNLAGGEATIERLRVFTAQHWSPELGQLPSDYDRVLIDWNHVRPLDPMY